MGHNLFKPGWTPFLYYHHYISYALGQVDTFVAKGYIYPAQTLSLSMIVNIGLVMLQNDTLVYQGEYTGALFCIHTFNLINKAKERLSFLHFQTGISCFISYFQFIKVYWLIFSSIQPEQCKGSIPLNIYTY